MALLLIIIGFRMNDSMTKHSCRQILFAGLSQASTSLFCEVGGHRDRFPDNFAFFDEDLKGGFRQSKGYPDFRDEGDFCFPSIADGPRVPVPGHLLSLLHEHGMGRWITSAGVGWTIHQCSCSGFIRVDWSPLSISETMDEQIDIQLTFGNGDIDPVCWDGRSHTMQF